MKWKTEYFDGFYKIYDWDKNLAGYFFPEYGDIEPAEKEDEIIEDLNKKHARVSAGYLTLPMVKLGLLDVESGMDIDFVIGSLGENQSRTQAWKQWLIKNAKTFSISQAKIYTAREDRNMLSINLVIYPAEITLGEKETSEFLSPLLNNIHEEGLL